MLPAYKWTRILFFSLSLLAISMLPALFRRTFHSSIRLSSSTFTSAMKEAIVQPDLSVKIIDSDIPAPRDDEVITKVVVSGSNPKDWKRPVVGGTPLNSGDDIAGIVHQVGSNVVEFKPGDRVAAFHEMMAPGGSFAQYAVSWAHTTFHIPKNTSFEGMICLTLPTVILFHCRQINIISPTEAATIPLAAMTSAVALYQRLEGLPLPWHPTTNPIPLIIYGAASAVGAFAIQLAQLSNIHPLICVAGKGIPFVEGLIDKSKGDVVLDYREGDEKLVQGIKHAVEKFGGKVEYALDAISEKGSYQNVCKVLDQQTGQIAVVLPGKDYSDIPESIKLRVTYVGSVHETFDKNEFQKATGSKTGNLEFGHIIYRFFGRGLQEGWFKGHPFEVVPGGLNGISQALKNLKDGKASAVKYVFKIDETEGL